jgi:LysR family transcriptional regulator, nitrogen assimilation regulatory protein
MFMNIMRSDAELLALARLDDLVEAPALPVIELRQLHHLVVLAACDSISAAAVQLGIAQPSLSELLTRMETRLGIKLVIRQGRGIQMTEAGLSLALRARSLLADVADALDEVRTLDDIAVGTVTIGIPPSLGMILSVALAETVQAELPGVRLHIVEGLSGDLIDWIQNGRLDLGCVLGSGATGSLVQEQIATEQLFLVTAPDNWEGAIGEDGVACEPVPLGEIERFAMAAPSARHGARREIDTALRAAGGRLNVGVEIDSLTQIVALVDRASAYALLPRASVMAQVESRRLALVPTVPRLERPIHIVRDRRRAVSRAATAVEGMVKMILRETIERHKLEATMLAA